LVSRSFVSNSDATYSPRRGCGVESGMNVRFCDTAVMIATPQPYVPNAKLADCYVISVRWRESRHLVDAFGCVT